MCLFFPVKNYLVVISLYTDLVIYQPSKVPSTECDHFEQNSISKNFPIFTSFMHCPSPTLYSWVFLQENSNIEL